MKRTAFDESRDQRIATESRETYLMCAAHGCPNVWSVSTNGRGLCSAHAWSDVKLWPRITQEQLDALVERARSRAKEDAREPVSSAERSRILDELRAMPIGAKASKEWACALKAREESGERLSQAQRDMWRAAIGRGATHEGD